MSTTTYIFAISPIGQNGKLHVPLPWLISTTGVAAITVAIYIVNTGVIIFARCKDDPSTLITLYQQLCYHEKSDYIALFVFIWIIFIFDLAVIAYLLFLYMRYLKKREIHKDKKGRKKKPKY